MDSYDKQFGKYTVCTGFMNSLNLEDDTDTDLPKNRIERRRIMNDNKQQNYKNNNQNSKNENRNENRNENKNENKSRNSSENKFDRNTQNKKDN